MNIDLTGDFNSPTTSDNSSIFMTTYSSKGSENSIAVVGKSCNLANLKIGEESELVVCSLPGFQGNFDYKILVSDARLEVVLDKHINLLIRVFLTELAQKLSAYGLNNDVTCSFIMLNKLILVYYFYLFKYACIAGKYADNESLLTRKLYEIIKSLLPAYALKKSNQGKWPSWLCV